MRPVVVFVALPVLVLAGFFAGRMVSGSLREVGEDRSTPVRDPSPAPAETRGLGDARDPRTGRDFRQSLEHVGPRKVAGGGSFRGRELYEDDRPGKRLLDLERAFALASEEDLLAFFSESDLTELGEDTLSAAYFRFGQIDIDKALSIWSDEFRRNGKGAGIDGLVKSWAGRDLLAAERWVDGLPAGKVRSQALSALLTGALDVSLDLVESRIFELDDLSSGAANLASELSGRVDLQRLPGIADRFLAEKRKGWSSQNELRALLLEWGERDATAMMTWLVAQPKGEVHAYVFARAVESQIDTDPAGFAKELGPSLTSSNSAMGEVAWVAIQKWLDQGNDDPGALAWIAENGAKLKVPEQTPWYEGMSRRWNAEDAAGVLDELGSLPGFDEKKLLARRVLNQLALSDPSSAMTLAKQHLPAGSVADEFLAKTVKIISGDGNDEGALELALQHLNEGEAKTNAVVGILSGIAEENPAAALDRAATLPESMREEIAWKLAGKWAQHSPQEVTEYLGKTTDPAIQASIAKAAFWRLGNRGGSEADLARALALPDETVKAEAVGALFRGWTEVNLESSGAALNSLEPGPLRDIAITEFVSNAARTDRNAALAWSLEIADPQKRRDVTMRQSRDWLISNREAATRWIESSEDLPAEWKAELLTKKP